MKTHTILTLVALACMPAIAQQPAQQPQQQSTPASAAQSIINQMGITTNALVDVLQGVTDKATADAAAREVGEIIVQLKLLNDLAGYAPDFAQDIEAMRQAQVNALMPMLMNTNPCYGSEAMLKALAPVVTIRQAQPEQQAQPEPVVQQPEPQPQPEPAVQQPQPAPQPQAVNPQNNAAQQTAAAILEGYRNLAAVLEGVHDKASADAAAPQAAQVIATILPLYDQAENSDELADFVGVQIAQTEEIDTLSDILENLLQAEPALYGSEALSATLANIVTVEEIQEEAPQHPVEGQPAPAPQPAVQQQATTPQPAYDQEYDEEEYEEQAPSAILAPMQQQ